MSAKLLSPFKFNNGSITKNRLLLSPMATSQSHADGKMSEHDFNWYRMRAEGGFGTIVTGGAAPSEYSFGSPGQIGIFSDDHIEAVKSFVNLSKSNEALSLVQLMHSGMRSPAKLNGGRQPVAPSVIKLDIPNFEVPRALTEDEILKIKEDFVQSALRVQQSGGSGIEIHGANGYLITQFLSKATNLRTDRWGGSTENRARLLLEIMRDMKARLPANFIIGVRLLAEDNPNQKGFDIDDTLETIKMMNDIGFTYLHISSFNALGGSWKYPESKESAISRIRKVLKSDIALVSSGGTTTVAQAEATLDDGADLAALARIALLIPDWPKKILLENYVWPTLPASPEDLAKVGVSPNFLALLKMLPMGIVK